MFKDAIGIIGGMGSFATLDIFRRILEAFPAEKEWERPRIFIDNNCTMPSRVRAILYHEKEDELKSALLCSAKNIAEMSLFDGGGYKIILGCNTAHNFLPFLKENLPEAQFIDIIEAVSDELFQKNIATVSVLATEGTAAAKIYDSYLGKRGIKIDYPSPLEQTEIRDFIECVKQNLIDEKCVKRFSDFLNGCRENAVVLGCTELPVLYGRANKDAIAKKIFDPIESAIRKLKEVLK